MAIIDENIEIKLKTKEWFTKNAYKDDAGDYWENEETHDIWSASSPGESVEANLGRWICEIYLKKDLEKGLEQGLARYRFMTTHIGNLNSYEWACDEEFIQANLPYFI